MLQFVWRFRDVASTYYREIANLYTIYTI